MSYQVRFIEENVFGVYVRGKAVEKTLRQGVAPGHVVHFAHFQNHHVIEHCPLWWISADCTGWVSKFYTYAR